MLTEEVALQYHDRFTRGELLTSEEQAGLEEWYTSQDALETTWLKNHTAPPPIQGLPVQIEAILIQIATMAQQVQTLMAQNQTLRQEISLLRHQLRQFSQGRPVVAHDYA